MKWRTGRRSSNVEDRRGTTSANARSGQRGGFGGGGFRFPGGGRRMPGGGMGGGMGPGMGGGRGRRSGGIGVVGILLVIGAMLIFGIDPSALLTGSGGPSGYQQTEPVGRAPTPAPQPGVNDELAEFVSVVLADTEDTWHGLFERMGGRYREPTLVLFSDAVDSACGFAEAAMGPFYCPADQKVYIDLSFYRDLRDRHGAEGDFAQAYVIAHEIGHHVQNLLGISSQVQQARQRASKAAGNELSVRLELQADCLAGVWAHHAEARGILDPGDVEEALTAAAAIGDDRLQKQSRGFVTPDSFTHGSSAQRMQWFRAGLDTGDINACDTFDAARL
jgi:uncharacterized protein